MDAQEFKTRVKARCIEVQKYGYKLRADKLFGGNFYLYEKKFTSPTKYVCPIAACMLNATMICDNSVINNAVHYFKISKEDLWNFIDGWDGRILNEDLPFYNVGKELRKEFGF